jgi:hypothetical protein
MTFSRIVSDPWRSGFSRCILFVTPPSGSATACGSKESFFVRFLTHSQGRARTLVSSS